MSSDSRIIHRQSTEAPASPRRPAGFIEWLRTIAAVRQARRRLRRLVMPPRSRGSPPLSAHLRRDLGLGPHEEGRHYWDHE